MRYRSVGYLSILCFKCLPICARYLWESVLNGHANMPVSLCIRCRPTYASNVYLFVLQMSTNQCFQSLRMCASNVCQFVLTVFGNRLSMAMPTCQPFIHVCTQPPTPVHPYLSIHIQPPRPTPRLRSVSISVCRGRYAQRPRALWLCLCNL